MLLNEQKICIEVHELEFNEICYLQFDACLMSKATMTTFTLSAIFYTNKEKHFREKYSTIFPFCLVRVTTLLAHFAIVRVLHSLFFHWKCQNRMYAFERPSNRKKTGYWFVFGIRNEEKQEWKWLLCYYFANAQFAHVLRLLQCYTVAMK